MLPTPHIISPRNGTAIRASDITSPLHASIETLRHGLQRACLGSCAILAALEQSVERQLKLSALKPHTCWWCVCFWLLHKAKRMIVNQSIIQTIRVHTPPFRTIQGRTCTATRGHTQRQRAPHTYATSKHTAAKDDALPMRWGASALHHHGGDYFIRTTETSQGVSPRGCAQNLAIFRMVGRSGTVL